jgi:DNA topoisomerase-1
MKVIIAEKEEAGKKIAEILLGASLKKYEEKKVTFFGDGETFVVPARGHVVNFSIRGFRSVKSLRDLPKADVFWTVRGENRARFELIGSLLKKADEFVVATDWDREGEVIGFDLVKYTLGVEEPKKIPRAYYSALREEDVIRAFRDVGEMNESLVTQGLARNYADLIVGLNLTKALSLVFRRAHGELGQAISLGRVQSPLLNYVKNYVGVRVRERAELYKNEEESTRWFVDFGDFQVEVKLPSEPASQTVEVLGIEEREETVAQAEVLYNTDDMMGIGLNPDDTMAIMEQLYLKGFLTYPRTTSRYVRDVGFLKEIEEAIRKYKQLPPEWGWTNTPRKRVEEAHPDAILLTPEGVQAYFEGKIKGREKFIADVVLYRTIRSFAPPLKRVRKKLKLRYRSAEGMEECEVDWGEEYSNLEQAIKYVNEQKYPEVEKGEYRLIKVRELRGSRRTWGNFGVSTVTVGDVELVQWMSQTGIGTEATRQTFPNLLRERNYTDHSNLPTALGEVVGSIIEKIGLSPSLTATMEDRIESLKKLDELNGFLIEVVEWTRKFIEGLEGVSPPEFECPYGHRATLVNRMNKFTGQAVLLLWCKTCNKYYGV